MLIGQSVFLPSAGTPGVIYFGPWVARHGDGMTAVMEILRASSSGWSFRLEVETKNAEDSDAAAASLGSTAPTTVGTHTLHVTGCKELVRYKFSGTGGGADRWLHFRSNPMLWQPN